jgi:hypothetical protein
MKYFHIIISKLPISINKMIFICKYYYSKVFIKCYYLSLIIEKHPYRITFKCGCLYNNIYKIFITLILYV